MDSSDFSERVRLRDTSQGDITMSELLIDDVPVRYGQFADGTFFIYDNAYVWSRDLRELGRQLVIDRAHGRLPIAGDRIGGGE
jgi:hypothetical protein